MVAAITPSNFPIEVILNKLGPALATGNTVVLKPDPNTPWNATRLGRLIAEHTDIPAGRGECRADTVQRGRRDAGHRSSCRHDLVHRFHRRRQATDAAGRRHHETMFLELGGKSVSIVLDDANPAAILGAAVGVCVHAGQACAATTRMLVHRSLFDDAVADYHRGVRGGAGRRPGRARKPLSDR